MMETGGLWIELQTPCSNAGVEENQNQLFECWEYRESLVVIGP